MFRIKAIKLGSKAKEVASRARTASGTTQAVRTEAVRRQGTA